MNNYITYCGFVAIIGRSNVGKSTLINQLLGEKISITSRKFKTTRQCITGIYTEGKYQIIYLDTPGLDLKHHNTSLIHQNLSANFLIDKTIKDVDLIIFVVDSIIWTINDEAILNKLSSNKTPLILAINKIDNVQNKINLLPYIQFISKKRNFFEIVPISAKKGKNINSILEIIKKKLPKHNHLYSKEYITTCSERFIASEIIREKLMRFLGEEIPYESSVEIENFTIINGNYNINGTILVKNNNQKKIIIGHKGNKIKTISKEARLEMEKIFKTKTCLYLWIKTYPYLIS
ncbi:GTPase Era [Candidatus Pantoea edessiphila]|uniref:GTPase Era n=1 Tax=Candidatus Pantoea edessiphila TaxID=2044610 RepID=A0A2P5T139_9GAMM|nr:GTPase Era [Candidatus Pantoea edessiphila]PPI88273.1 GTPase Era [Candidatus Pantoea edessiphila]